MITASEITEGVNTVPAESDHADIVETINRIHAIAVTNVQLHAHANIRRLEVFLTEEKAKGKKLAELNYLEIAIQRKIDEIRAESTWAIKVLDLDRNDSLTKLHKWENRVA